MTEAYQPWDHSEDRPEKKVVGQKIINLTPNVWEIPVVFTDLWSW